MIFVKLAVLNVVLNVGLFLFLLYNHVFTWQSVTFLAMSVAILIFCIYANKMNKKVQ